MSSLNPCLDLPSRQQCHTVLDNFTVDIKIVLQVCGRRQVFFGGGKFRPGTIRVVLLSCAIVDAVPTFIQSPCSSTNWRVYSTVHVLPFCHGTGIPFPWETAKLALSHTLPLGWTGLTVAPHHVERFLGQVENSRA